jgi:hypothetical protein
VPVPPLAVPPPPADDSAVFEGELQATRGGRTRSETRERKLTRRDVDESSRTPAMVFDFSVVEETPLRAETVKGRKERKNVIN